MDYYRQIGSEGRRDDWNRRGGKKRMILGRGKRNGKERTEEEEEKGRRGGKDGRKMGIDQKRRKSIV